MTGPARPLAQEVPVAIVANGSTIAVMMATPADLADFARGFVVTEGLAAPSEVTEVEVVDHAQGFEARLWLPATRAQAMDARRRKAVGPVGCGLCGIESLQAALRPLPPLQAEGPMIAAAEVPAALSALRQHQPLHDLTRAMHAAGFWQGGRIVMAREDVGRHNALDKLVGALLAAGIEPSTGAIVLTSRVSVDMVQKTVTAGCPVLIAASAPTALALDVAREAGLTLATTGPVIHTHPERLTEAPRVA